MNVVDRLRNLEIAGETLPGKEARLANDNEIPNDAIRQENMVKMAAFQTRLDNQKQKNLEDLKQLKKDENNNNNENIANSVAENLFVNLIDRIRESFENSRKEDIDKNISNLARILLANLYSISALIGKQNQFERISLIKCEMFLQIFRELDYDDYKKKYSKLNYQLEDAIQVIISNDCPEDMRSYMNVECIICLDLIPRNRILNLNCKCNICIDCFKEGYNLAINNAQALISINEFSCLACKEPRFDPKNKTEFQSHLELLTMLFSYHLEQKEKDRFQKTLTEICINDMNNLVWCSHGCGDGVIAPAYYEKHLKVKCNICKKHTCYKCKQMWEELQHEGKTCDEIVVDEALNQEETISCPSCKQKFLLAKGGCLHYTCPCKFEFCGCCRNQYSKQKMDYCEKYLCNITGFHVHHLYNCFSYIGDFTVKKLADHLILNGKALNVQVQQLLKCPVLESKENGPGVFVDVVCDNDVFPLNDATYGLCDKHFRLHLYNQLIKEKVEILSLYETDNLKLIIERHKIVFPPKISIVEDENEKRRQLIAFINEKIPVPDLSKNRF